MSRLANLSIVVVLIGVARVAAQPQDAPPLDRDFLIKTITCNHAEVKASELVASRSGNDKVKTFAMQLAKEHKAVSEKLAKIGADQKLAILAGTEKETKDMLNRLSNLEGVALDREYLKTVIDEHEKAIKMFEAQAKQGKDAALTDFAKDTLPHLRNHLKEAQQLAAEIKAKQP